MAYPNFYSIIAIENPETGLTTCTINFSPKGKKYVVVCKPNEIPGNIDRLLSNDIQRLNRRMQDLMAKQRKMFDRLYQEFGEKKNAN